MDVLYSCPEAIYDGMVTYSTILSMCYINIWSLFIMYITVYCCCFGILGYECWRRLGVVGV